MTDKPLVGVREFRDKLHTYEEPVTVVHTRGTLRVLGTWIPEGYAPGKKKSANARNRTDG